MVFVWQESIPFVLIASTGSVEAAFTGREASSAKIHAIQITQSP